MTVEKSGLAIIKKEDYMRVLKRAEKSTEVNMVEFLKNNSSIFQKFRTSIIKEIVQYSS